MTEFLKTIGVSSKDRIVVNLYGALLSGDKRHAQEIMKDLGITYERSEPQMIADQWMFFQCENVPDELPDYVF